MGERYLTGALPPAPQLSVKVAFVFEDVQGKGKGAIESLELGRGEPANEIGQDGLGQADELVAVDAAVVLETLFDPYRDLSGQTIMHRVDRSADDGGETGFDEDLPADDHEDAGPLRVSRGRAEDPVELPSPQGTTW
jgi:hypothetical protein